MPAASTLLRGAMSVVDYRCTAGPGDVPFVEVYGSYSFSYVRRGSFGCRTRGRGFELVTGAILVGRPGDEFLCTHDHHPYGDECLSFHVAPELIEALGHGPELWESGALPPRA